MSEKNGIVRRSVTHTEYYAEPIPVDPGSDSGVPNLFGEWWFWGGCAIAIALFTHQDSAPVIINNQAPPPVIINNN